MRFDKAAEIDDEVRCEVVWVIDEVGVSSIVENGFMAETVGREELYSELFVK